MSTHVKLRRFCIVVALDDSEYAEIVLEHALDQAIRHDQVDLHFITVVAPRDGQSAIAAAKQRLLAQVSGGIEGEHGAHWRARLHIQVGNAAEEIAGIAGELDADLLVLGRFGVHATRKLASTADAVLTRVACPTLVVALGGRTIETEKPCPGCAAVREESAGERWFCAAHASPDRLDLTTRISGGLALTHGGPLW